MEVFNQVVGSRLSSTAGGSVWHLDSTRWKSMCE